MTEATTIPAEVLDYCQSWAASVSEVIGQIAGAPLAVECASAMPPGTATAAESDVWLIAACEGALRGEMSLRLAQAEALRLAQIFMAEPAKADAELGAESREAVLELFRQVAGHVATALKPTRGEVQVRMASGTKPSWAAAATVWLFTATDIPARFNIEIQISAALSANLQPVAKEAAPSAPELAVAPPLPNEPGKLEMLMDVELSVSLHFGGRTMLLRDILELCAGTVVELDRQIQEPVELLLEGRTVARGEVVLVEGNYGLRVTELLPLHGG